MALLLQAVLAGLALASTFGRRFASELVAAGCRFDLMQIMSLVKAWVSGEQQLQAEADEQDRAAQGALPKFLQPLVATTDQVARRQKIIDAFVDERAVNFTNSQRFYQSQQRCPSRCNYW